APEANLSALVEAASGTSVGAGAVFGITSAAGLWSRVVDDFKAVLATAVRMLGYAAWVESSAAGRLFGRTVVTWKGEQLSAWPANPTRHEVFAHSRVLDLAIRT